MSVELVTGYSGVGSDGQPNRHVSSADDGARQAGTVGTGMYVLGTGSKMSATMEDANTLVVADGDALINGRHVRIPDTLSFTIPTGVQGQKVSNLAVLRYSKAADSVESVTPVVLTGEPDPDSPADPALSEGSVLDGDSPVDMPLYRVVTDGINAGEPEPLFDVMMSMAELRDSVSRMLVVRSGSSAFSISPGGYVTLTMDVADSTGLKKLAVAGFSTGGVAITVAQVQLSASSGRVVMALNNTTNVQRSGTATVDVLCAAPL